MRKLLLVLAVVVVLLLLVLAVVPLFFQDRLRTLVETEASEALAADVRLDGVGLSLLRAFPHAAVTVQGLTVTSREPFAGTVLASLDRATVVVDLFSLLGDEGPEIRKVEVHRPTFHVVVDAEGRSNLDAALGTEEAAPAPEAEAPSDLQVRLRSIVVEDLALTWDDQEGDLYARVEDLDHRSRGDVSGATVRFDTRTTIGSLTARYGGVAWLADTRWVAEGAVAYDMDTSAVALEAFGVEVNALPVRLDGRVEPQDAGILFDLTFGSPGAEFRHLLSLVPALYAENFEDLQAAGTLTLQGKVAGLLPDEGDDLPPFDLAITLADGRFSYGDLPAAVEQVSMDLAIGHPGGTLDATVVDLSRFHAQVGGSPLDGHLRVTNLDTDPLVDLAAQGRLDLGTMARAFPEEAAGLGGVLDMDLEVKGRVSQFEAADVSAVTARGTLRGKDVSWQDEDLGVPVVVEAFDLSLDPGAAHVAEYRIRAGTSDLQGTARLEDVVAWAFDDQPLTGTARLESRLLDLDALAGDDGGDGAADDDDLALMAVPGDLDLTFEARCQRVVYGGVDLRDLVGTVRVVDGVARLEGLTFQTLGGTVRMSGAYAAPTDQEADVDVDIRVQDMAIPQAVAAFEFLRTLAPVAEKLDAPVSADLVLETTLGPDLAPRIPTLQASGRLAFGGGQVQPTALDRVAERLGVPALSTLSLKGKEVRFQVRDGQTEFGPLALRAAGVDGTLTGGTQILRQTMDLALALQVPASLLQADLLQQAGLAPTGPVPVTVRVTGPYGDPQVRVELGDLAGAVGDQIRERVTEEVQERVGAEVERLVAQARAQGDRLVAQAEQQAEALRKEARTQAQALRTEAKKKGDRLEAQAKGNPVKEAAAREAAKQLAQEADKAARKLEREADRKAETLVTEAKAQRDRLIREAGG